MAPVCSERETDTEFIGAAGYTVRHQAINSDAREQHRKQAEERTQLCNQAVVEDRVVDDLSQRNEFANREIRVDLGSDLSDRTRNGIFASRVPRDEIIAIADVLGMGIENSRHLPLVQVHVLGVFNHAYNFEVLPLWTL